MNARLPAFAAFTLALLLALPALRASATRHILDPAPPAAACEALALAAGQPATLRLLPAVSEVNYTASSARLHQLASSLAAPLDTPVTVTPDPSDARLLLVRFTPPAVNRPTRFALRLGAAPPVPLLVFPSTRDDLPSLSQALAASRLHLAVSGLSPELRAWLRSEDLPFEDLGAYTPDRLRADTLLLAAFPPPDSPALVPTASTRLLVFVDAPTTLPGVYPHPSARFTKVTLPLLPSLPFDPRARETLHTLLLQALPPASP